MTASALLAPPVWCRGQGLVNTVPSEKGTTQNVRLENEKTGPDFGPGFAIRCYIARQRTVNSFGVGDSGTDSLEEGRFKVVKSRGQGRLKGLESRSQDGSGVRGVLECAACVRRPAVERISLNPAPCTLHPEPCTLHPGPLHERVSRYVGWSSAVPHCSSPKPPSSEYGTYETVKARFWP